MEIFIDKEHVKFLSEPSSKPVNPIRKMVQPFRGPLGKSIETIYEIGDPQLTIRPTNQHNSTHTHIDESYVRI